jgi:hypothetical protein
VWGADGAAVSEPPDQYALAVRCDPRRDDSCRAVRSRVAHAQGAAWLPARVASTGRQVPRKVADVGDHLMAEQAPSVMPTWRRETVLRERR